MNYRERYDKLIESAVGRWPTRKSAPCYVEKHHILPKCMGGDNSKDNLVFLTAQEHYEAHRLLAMAYPEERGLQFAWWNFCSVTGQDGKRREQITISPQQYELAKLRRSSLVSEQAKKQWKEPENRKIFLELVSKNGKKMWENNRHIISNAISEKNRKSWQDPKYREEMSNMRSEQNKELAKDPKWRESMVKRNQRSSIRISLDMDYENTRPISKIKDAEFHLAEFIDVEIGDLVKLKTIKRALRRLHKNRHKIAYLK